ncbi:MAG: PAS domain-containing protein, partial [Halanaerobiales bacterium]|nr:PAS domain-containing protein [Halanaerobiales bacterium]
MNKIENLADDPSVIGQLQTRISALEEECLRLRRLLPGDGSGTAAPVASREDRGELLLRFGSYEWDESADRCLGCSPGMAGLFGTTAGDLTSRMNGTSAFLEQLHPADRDPYQRALAQLRTRHVPIDIEYRLLSADTPVWIHEIREPVVDACGQL